MIHVYVVTSILGQNKYVCVMDTDLLNRASMLKSCGRKS